jgi:hypothetical protein
MNFCCHLDLLRYALRLPIISQKVVWVQPSNRSLKLELASCQNSDAPSFHQMYSTTTTPGSGLLRTSPDETVSWMVGDELMLLNGET